MPKATTLALVLLLLPATALALDCDQEATALNFSGPGEVVCPCFAVGERAGVVLSPAGATTDSLEVLRVGIGWGSQFGGAPTALEQAIHVYGAGLPNPGAPVFSLVGPQLNDGFLNEFDLATQGGPAIVANADFAIALEFLNSNANDFFAPSVVHDGNGCTPGRNMVYTGGNWFDACGLGVSGDWVMYAVYQPHCTATSVPGELYASNRALFLAPPRPNPATGPTTFEFFLREAGSARLAVYDLRGREVSRVADRDFAAGMHTLGWDGRGSDGSRLPAGRYFVELSTAAGQAQRAVTLLR